MSDTPARLRRVGSFRRTAADPSVGRAATRAADPDVPAPADSRPSTDALDLLGLASILAALGTFGLGAYRGHDTVIGFVALPLILGLLAPMLRRVRAAERDYNLAGLMLLSCNISMIAAYFRMIGAKDAAIYQREGERLSEFFRELDFFVATGRETPGTGTIRYLSGLVNVVTNDSMFATFLVFALFSFFGRYFFLRAFETGFPDGVHKRYAYLVMLWPSLVFWPSSIGKEAVMILSVGLASWGAARLLRSERNGLPLLTLGTFGAGMVRPHVAVILFIAVVIATIFRKRDGDTRPRVLAKLATVAVLLVGGSVLATETASFLDLENLGTADLSSALDDTEVQTTQGGSKFAPARVRSPLDFPWAVTTVFLRPFPQEADGLQGLFSASESILLILLLARAWPAIRHLPSLLFRRAYVVYAMAYVGAFTVAFSVIGNFGILVRQRTQGLPLLLILVALPPAGRLLLGEDEAAPDPATDEELPSPT